MESIMFAFTLGKEGRDHNGANLDTTFFSAQDEQISEDSTFRGHSLTKHLKRRRTALTQQIQSI